jgi:hypothetical protein
METVERSSREKDKRLSEPCGAIHEKGSSSDWPGAGN